MATSAPACARASANALPTRTPAPVTIAVSPCRSTPVMASPWDFSMFRNGGRFAADPGWAAGRLLAVEPGGGRVARLTRGAPLDQNQVQVLGTHGDASVGLGLRLPGCQLNLV